jgi:hypothetical protein
VGICLRGWREQGRLPDRGHLCRHVHRRLGKLTRERLVDVTPKGNISNFQRIIVRMFRETKRN